MKNANDYRVMADEAKIRKTEAEREQAKEYCENELAPIIERESRLGETWVKIELPTNVNVDKVGHYLKNHGFSVLVFGDTFDPYYKIKISWE